VKCDEAKPKCMRCQKFGGGVECIYPTFKAFKPDSTGASRILIPKLGNSKPPAVAFVPHYGRFGPELDEMEGRCLQFFCEISSEITGPFKTSVWNRLIPQAGDAYPLIRHSILALSALSKARAETKGNRSQARSLLAKSHHEFAIKQYCKALKELRGKLGRINGDVRTVLIACLLIFSFETLQDNQNAASLHASGAVNLLMEYHQHHKNPSKPPNSYAPSYWACQSQIEEDLHSAFSYLDLQAFDQRPAGHHRCFVQQMNEIIKYIPAEFMDLNSCRKMFQLITRRNFHWVSIARSTLQQRMVHQVHCNPVGGPHIAEMHFGNTLLVDSLINEIPATLLAEHQEYLEDINRWQRASKNLFEATGHRILKWTGTKLEDFIITALLRIHAAYQIVSLAEVLNPNKTTFDDYLPQFREMIELSALIYPHLVNGNGALFHFDLGIIPALSHVGMLCRDRELRSQAIEMLLRTPGYREGIFDAVAAGKLDQCAMEFEEPWRDESGNIPEGRRVKLVTVQVVLRERRATSIWKQRIGTENEKDVVERRAEIEW
jgi:hypothetical protein